jgi:hypothetical protein
VLYFEDGHAVSTYTRDVSMGGAGLERPDAYVEGRRATHLELRMADRAFLFPVEPVRSDKQLISVRFKDLSLENRRLLVLAVFGRADAWPSGGDAPQLTVTKAFTDLLRANVSLLPGVGPTLARRAQRAAAASAK